MSFDFETGQWQRDEKMTLVECAKVPEGLKQLIYNAGGTFAIRRSNGSIIHCIDPRNSIGYGELSDNDTIILYEQNEFMIPFETIFSIEKGKETEVFRIQFKLHLNIPGVIDFDRRVIQSNKIVTREMLINRLIGDTGLNEALSDALDRWGADVNSTKIFKPFQEKLRIIGLTLREVSGQVYKENKKVEEEIDIKPGISIKGQYEVVREIGNGATGSVWLVKDKSFNNVPRALKVVNQERFGPTLKDEIKSAEILTNRSCNKHHLVDLITVIMSNNILLLYEFVDGWPLYRYWAEKKERPTRTEIVRILKEILEGLEQLHKIGLIHRDLHNGNIMITREGHTVKILDLGFSVLEGTITAEEEVKTIKRFAPNHDFVEKLDRSYVKYDARTDLYSAGVLLWWMLTGESKLPTGKTLDESIPEWAKAYQPIIEKSCILPREERFISASEMIKALEEAARNPIFLHANPKGVYAIAFQPSGKGFITGGRDGNILYWDIASLECKVVFKNKLKEVRALSFLNESSFTIIQCTDAEHLIQTVNLETGDVLFSKTLNCHSYSSAISPIRKMFCLSSTLEHKATCYSLETGKRVTKSEICLDESINCLAFSRDGDLLAGGTSKNNIFIHDMDNGTTNLIKSNGYGAIWTINFNHDGTKLLIGGSSSEVSVADLKSKKVRELTKTGQTHGIACHPSKDHFAFGLQGGGVYYLEDGILRSIENDNTGKRLRPVWALTYAPDGYSLVFGEMDRDGKIAICGQKDMYRSK